MHTLREFSGYWWLFQMQDLSHYGARLIEERKKEEEGEEESSVQPFQVAHFGTVSIH